MKTAFYFTAHNEFSGGLPSITSMTGTEFTFHINELPEPLKVKLYGVIDYVELTTEEAKMILKVKYRNSMEPAASRIVNELIRLNKTV